MAGELAAALASLKIKYAAAASAAGPTYSIDGQSVNRMEYLAALSKEITTANQLIQDEDGTPVEVETYGIV